MSGWFLMHRGWMQSSDFQREPFTEREAFLWSIEEAAHSPHGQWFNGSRYEVGRGEFVTSLHTMKAAFRWSEKRVRGFRDRMIRCGKWTKRGAHSGAKAPQVITVCNYALFQAPAKPSGEAVGEAKGERGAKQGRSGGEEQKEGINNGNEGKAKKVEASPPRAPHLPYQAAIDAWSQAAAIKGWKPANPELTDKRRDGLGKILKAHGLDGFVAALQRALESEMLGGPDPPAWFNFTFVCIPDNFVKLKEGNYDRSFSSSSDKQSPWLDARAQLSGGLSNATRDRVDAEPTSRLLRISVGDEGAIAGEA